MSSFATRRDEHDRTPKRTSSRERTSARKRQSSESDSDRGRHAKKSKRQETSQERRERRTYKKAKKDEKRRAKQETEEQFIQTKFGISNGLLPLNGANPAVTNILPSAHKDNGIYNGRDNPFGDADLGTKFEWHKKKEADRKAGLSTRDVERRKREREVHAKVEMERLGQLRQQRQQDRAARDMAALRTQREREDADLGDWAAREHAFQLSQSRKRAALRLRAGRGHPLDPLILNFDDETHDDRLTALPSRRPSEDLIFTVMMEDPCSVFEGLTSSEQSELVSELKKQRDLDVPIRIPFYDNLLIVAQHTYGNVKHDPTGVQIHEDIMKRIHAMLRGKTLQELAELSESIRNKMDRKDQAMDPEFWMAVEHMIKVYKARNFAQDAYTTVYRERLNLLDRAADRERTPLLDLPLSDASGRSWIVKSLQDIPPPRTTTKSNSTGAAGTEDDSGDEDAKLERLFSNDALNDPEDREEMFRAEVELEKFRYPWASETVVPKKPRYFNRLISGLVWNKYNQVHYDEHNPPPQTTHGYKFNFFFQDRLDKKVVPHYRKMRDPSAKDDDTVLLIICGGAPYADIAFRIVNREWDMSSKHGYRCRFENGVLQLHFRFKPLVYRR